MSSRAEALANRIDRLVRALALRWLLILNVLVAAYLAVPISAPMLMYSGHTTAAKLVYLVFRPQCHQLPERSFFMYGERATYSLEDLEAAGVLPGLALHERAAFIGDEHIGYKVAFCQRDVATWGAILLAGLLFGLMGRRWRLLPLWGYALLLTPLAFDGTSQLLGLRESNWMLRTSSGALFGLATVWLAYPYVERAMNDVRDSPTPAGRHRQRSTVPDLEESA